MTKDEALAIVNAAIDDARSFEACYLDNGNQDDMVTVAVWDPARGEWYDPDDDDRTDPQNPRGDEIGTGEPLVFVGVEWDGTVIRDGSTVAEIAKAARECVLRDTLARYIDPDDDEYDPEFAREIMEARPDWFTHE